MAMATAPRKVLIVAGNRDQAETRAGALCLAPGEWWYASDAQSLRGITPSRVDYCGTYLFREDWYDLADELRIVEFRMAMDKEDAR